MCLIRIGCSLGAMAVIIGVFVLIMKACGSSATSVHFGSCFGSALFLGAVGLALSRLTDNVIAGFMAALVYYMANMGLKEKLGDFFLFTLSVGGTSINFVLYFWGIILIAATLIFAKPVRCT